MVAKYPLRSTKRQLSNSINKSNNIIKKNLRKNELEELKKINRNFVKGKDSYSRYKKNDEYVKDRQKVHKGVLSSLFKNKSSIDKKDPDLYILGGVASSGKSTVLGKLIPEKTVNIDSDEFKAKLSKYNKSPIKRFPLAHSSYLQREAGDLVTQSLNIARKQKRDVTLDATLGNRKKIKNQVKKFKRAGYDVHLLGTQKYPHNAVVDATNRFLEKGRFVPPFIIAGIGNKINKNVMDFRKYSDSNIIYDTDDWNKKKIISKSKKGLKYNFRNPKN